MKDLNKFVKKLDLFRRIDEGFLASGTAHGGTFSIIAYALMVVLATFEFSAYLSSDTTSTVLIDVNQDESLLIRFTITMLDLPCKYAAVDVYDSFGEERQNITKAIKKTRVHLVHGRLQEGELHEDEDIDHPTIVDPAEIELDEDGHHALDLQGAKGVYTELKAYDYTLLNFYAPWCHYCKALAPIYEKAADEFDKISFTHKSVRAKFASLNCEKYPDVCRMFKIRAYPTLLIFNENRPLYPYYSGDRTVEALVEYLKKAIITGEIHKPTTYHDLACKIEGSIEVARVPGNFHVEARSTTENISPSMANVSHLVHNLQFGEPLDPALVSKLPRKHQYLIHPLDGR